MPLSEKLNNQLTGDFKHGQCCACTTVPIKFIWCIICPGCAAAHQRFQILRMTREPYVCCGGLIPVCGLDKPRSESCVFLECIICCPETFAANRFLVQTRFNKRNSGCWDFSGTICHTCVSVQCEIARLCCDIPQEREELAKARSCCCPCGYCQNSIELDMIEARKKRYSGPPPAMIQSLPRHFANIGITGPGTPVQVPPQHVMRIR